MSESYGSTTDVAKNEAQAMGGQVKEGGKHMAEVSKEEVKNVTAETGQQAKQLLEQTRSQLVSQSAQQQDRLAQGIRSLSEELSSMAQNSEQSGVASDLAKQASQKVGDVAGWLESRDPGALVEELKSFARQRPGVFLAAAAAVGLVGGRMSRGLVAEHQESSVSSSQGEQYRAGDVATETATLGGYSTYESTTGTPVVQGAGTAPLASGTAGVADPFADPLGDPLADPMAEDPRAVDPLAPIDPRTGRERTGAGRDADENGDEVLR